GDGAIHVWDLRAIRTWLAAHGLDWDLPPCPQTQEASTEPLQVQVIGAARAEQSPLALNREAWKMLTGPAEQRDPVKALALIRAALDQQPGGHMLLNTLGVAEYRNGMYQEAVATLEKSLASGKGEWDAFDLFFLSMCHAKLGSAAKAKDYFDRAV